MLLAGSDRAQGAFPVPTVTNHPALRAAVIHVGSTVFSCQRNVFFQRRILHGHSLIHSNTQQRPSVTPEKRVPLFEIAGQHCTFPELPSHLMLLIYLLFTTRIPIL